MTSPSIHYKETPLLIIVIWFGGQVPDYVPQFIASVKRNPNVNMLIPSMTNSPGLCDGDRPHTRYDGNIKYVCMTKESMLQLFSHRMCTVWKCTQEEEEKVLQSTRRFLKTPYPAATEFKVAFADIFEEMYTEWRGRTTPFSYWLRVDMDMIMGDFSVSFPWHMLGHFDVIGLKPSYGWKGLWLSGAGAAFRLTPSVNQLWLRIAGLQTPETYCKEFSTRTGWLGSNDEGALGKIVVSSSDVTFIFLPHAILQDILDKWHIDVRGDSDLKSVIYVPNEFQDREVLSFHQAHVPLNWTSTKTEHGVQVMVWWIPEAARVCVETEEPDSIVHWNVSEVIWREKAQGEIYWSTMNNPFLSSYEFVRNGQTVKASFLQPALFHLVTWKKIQKVKEGFRREPLGETEMITDLGGKWTITKYE
ncbi:hypothetical protein PROFUN_10207 [Planoprotostelium fungivorum]|uniref:Uncharacterized protein n=1 Tax=Planoprotostelium fungivorum TaxID=1890364 RepID=A0A2P6MQ67_9EUKA|nr:hypothetical protein PROFUN_10207 [Planoprotostelium fungivorum]